MSDASSLPSRLPAPDALERKCKALAMLDAVLSPEWESRYYSFNRSWSPEQGTRMASMRNGSGDEYYLLFFPDGSAALKGLDHESAALRGQASVEGVLDGLPARFDAFANEPAFEMDRTSFCLWNEGDGWRRSASVSAADVEVDGSAWMLAALAGTADDYARFAKEYFDKEVPVSIVARFFALEPLSSALATALDPDADLDAIAGDVDEIGYPLAT